MFKITLFLLLIWKTHTYKKRNHYIAFGIPCMKRHSTTFKACVYYFLPNSYFSPNDIPFMVFKELSFGKKINI